MRAGFIKGALRRVSAIPKLVFGVRGWTGLAADAMGRKREPYVLQKRGGCSCEVRGGASDWWIFLEIFVFGIYQKVEADARKARVVIDVGANVGMFAVYAASLNRNAEIHAFEPFPKNLTQLERNLALNPGHHIKPHLAAVSDKSGTATLYFTPGDDSGCSLSQAKGESCVVKTVGINDLFQYCGVARCDLLKMDCEGSELPIFEAASSDTLAKVGAVIMEYHNDNEIPRLCEILAKNGFKPEVLSQIHTIYADR